ncbi:MAG TPA: 5'/3'-nucleotidase SurE [Atribacteraceae bacterium]|nr:5'/3'-nucleotidase SurE [Atribacteraceae bacterium]
MKRKVLITNDDGYKSEGIRALVREFRDIADVLLVAPSEEKSCSSHSITPHQSIVAREIEVEGVQGFAVDGTPADTVILGLNIFRSQDQAVDLVVSGINRGANLGFDVFYSGTVAAAMEAAMSGVSAMAVSLSLEEAGNYHLAAEVTREIFYRFEETLMGQKNLVLNVNIPDRSSGDDLKSWVITELGDRFFFTRIKQKLKENGMHEFIFEEEKRKASIQKNSDFWAVWHSHVSITPLRPSLTDYLIKNDLLAVLSRNG